MLSDASQRRFQKHSKTGSPMVLAETHPAVVEGRSLFTKSAGAARGSGRVLISGHNQRKLGRRVMKGRWSGFEIYTLTLEERKTCPRTCTEWRSCLIPETPVLTADLRWVELGSLKIGDRIAGFDEEKKPDRHRFTKIATVEAVGRAIEPCFQIITDRGTVIASAGHQWLRRRSRTSYSWLPTHKIAIGDKLQFFSEPWETDRSYDAGRMRGFVEGEGTCGTWGEKFAKARVGWSQRPTRLCDEIIGVARRLGFRTARYERIAGVNQSPISHVDITDGWRGTLKFIGRIRPTRMIEKAEELWSNHSTGGRGGKFARVLSITPAGDQEVVTIRTSTRTMVAGGFFTHNCYGNRMQWSIRHPAGAELEGKLEIELAELQAKHPRGFVVRLHILGDFYSTGYVERWRGWLDRFPALHVFGYTARQGDEIASALEVLIRTRWDRFAVRSSGAVLEGIPASVVIDLPEQAGPAIICPAQTDKTAGCYSCALCWSTTKAVAFLKH